MMRQLMQENDNIRGLIHRTRSLKFILSTIVMEPFDILLRREKFRDVVLDKLKEYVSVTGNRSFGKRYRSKVARINVY